MNIYHISAECYPVAKVGGLGDVVGALPKYQNRLSVNASVIMPWYDRDFVNEHEFEAIFSDEIRLGTQLYRYQVLKNGKVLGFNLFLVKIPGLLDRKEVYGYADEHIQFIAFQYALLHWLCAKKDRQLLLHCHDHHSGLIPFFIEHCDEFEILKGTPTVGTVHNGQYQGWMDWQEAVLMPKLDWNHRGLLDWDGVINPLAALIKCCWAYTTVSEGYLEELFDEANGLETLFFSEKQKAHGIVNGIDFEVWNPSKDPLINHNYQHEEIEGKQKNKKAFCKQFGFSYRLPLFSFIGRLVYEKGADLLPLFIDDMMNTYADKLSFMVLGSGSLAIERELLNLQDAYPGRVAVKIGYDEALSHQIYASSDFLFMPSRVEPCGLNQLYAMRYGTMPIVRKTGGLADTVTDVSLGGTGISFENESVSEVSSAIGKAIAIHKRKVELNRNRKKMMEQDFSWQRSAQKYIDIYKSLI